MRAGVDACVDASILGTGVVASGEIVYTNTANCWSTQISIINKK
jgi:hypothetical protein